MQVNERLLRPRALGFWLFFTPWLAMPAIVVFFFVLANHSFANLAMFVVGPAWALSAVISAIWCGYLAWKRAWRPGLLALILPVAMLLNPWAFIRVPAYVGDVIRFAAMKSSYDRRVASLPHDRPPVVEFNWGGMTFASDGVAYDETDEISLPKNRRSAGWLSREKNTDLTCGGTDLYGTVQPLWGHYYLANFGC